MAFVERHRGQVPLNFDKGWNRREEVCDEGVGLCGERVRCPTIFLKSTIRHLMTEAGIMTNQWSIEMLESLFALADYHLH